MIRGRPARSRERPEFGSVWRWTETGWPIIVLTTKPNHTSRGIELRLVGINPNGDVRDGWIWTRPSLDRTRGGEVLRGWECLDEGGPEEWPDVPF